MQDTLLEGFKAYENEFVCFALNNGMNFILKDRDGKAVKDDRNNIWELKA